MLPRLRGGLFSSPHGDFAALREASWMKFRPTLFATRATSRSGPGRGRSSSSSRSSRTSSRACSARVSPDAKAGDLVAVYDKHGQRVGAGLYNPRAKIPLRVVCHSAEPVGEDYFEAALRRAVALAARLAQARRTDRRLARREFRRRRPERPDGRPLRRRAVLRGHQPRHFPAPPEMAAAAARTLRHEAHACRTSTTTWAASRASSRR